MSRSLCSIRWECRGGKWYNLKGQISGPKRFRCLNSTDLSRIWECTYWHFFRSANLQHPNGARCSLFFPDSCSLLICWRYSTWCEIHDWWLKDSPARFVFSDDALVKLLHSTALNNLWKKCKFKMSIVFYRRNMCLSTKFTVAKWRSNEAE